MSSDGDSLKRPLESDFFYYEVKPGDSMASIAAHFGYLTPSQLGRVNSLPYAGCSLPHVFPGQRLIIPTMSKSALPASRVRHAPGAALRVHSISDTVSPAVREHYSIAGFRLQDFYAVHPGASQKQKEQQSGLTEETNAACQLINIPVKRVVFQDSHVPPPELVDGILIITPDMLCFDTLAQEPQGGRSTDLVPAGAPDHENREDPPRHSTSVSLLLSEIVSMTTLKSLDEVYKAMIRTPQRLASAPDVLLDKPMSPRPTDEEAVDVAPSSGTAGSGAGGEEEPPAAPSPLVSNGELLAGPLEHRNGGRGEADSPPACHDSGSDGALETTTTTTAGGSSLPRTCSALAAEAASPLLLKQVYLRLGSLTRSPNSSGGPGDYCFEISTNHLARVHAFLLHAGLGTTHADGGATSSQAKPFGQDGQLQRQTSRGSTSDGSVSPGPEKNEAQANRGSLVEQMLQSVDESSPMPSLFGGQSVILTDDMLLDLGYNMPVHLTGCNLSLVYSTEANGFSLATLYRMSSDVSGSVLLVIRDTMGTVFGAIMSERMHRSQLFYGTGETCVFHWSPNFKRYDWTKKNYHLMHGSPNGFHIGGQSGRSAIWFDGALKYGRSEPTDTFNNPVLSGCLGDLPCPTGTKEAIATGSESTGLVESVPFIIDSLEVWELIS